MKSSDHRPLLALGLRSLAAVLVATMFMLGKVLGQRGVAVPEVLFWSRFITVPMLLCLLWWRGGIARLATKRINSHFFRAVCGMGSMGLTFTAARMLHLSEFTILNFTAPLFAVLITGLFMQETVGPWRWTAALIGVVGVVVIAQPGNSAIPLSGAICGLLAALSVAVISFQIRDLARTEESVCAVFWYAVFGTVLMAAFLPFVARAHDAGTWGLLILIGVVCAISQWLLTASLRHGTVASVTVMDMTQLLWATLYGWLIWSQLPPPTLWLGAPLVVAAGVVIAWREHRVTVQARRSALLEAEA